MPRPNGSKMNLTCLYFRMPLCVPNWKRSNLSVPLVVDIMLSWLLSQQRKPPSHYPLYLTCVIALVILIIYSGEVHIIIKFLDLILIVPVNMHSQVRRCIIRHYLKENETITWRRTKISRIVKKDWLSTNSLRWSRTYIQNILKGPFNYLNDSLPCPFL